MHMRFETPAPKEAPEQARIRALADAAERLAKEWESPNHIWKALDQAGITVQAERAAWFKKIYSELKKRGASPAKEEPLSKQEWIIRDAERFAAGHPEDGTDAQDEA